MIKNTTEDFKKSSSRGSFFWPLLLITIGIILLLNNLNLLPWSIWTALIRFWPLILILAGLEILLGRSRTTNLIVTTVGIVILITILIIYIPGITSLFSQPLPQFNLPGVFNK